MQLLTKEIEQQLIEGAQAESADPIVVTKFFDPSGAATWWITEYDPETRLFFGYATLGMGPDCDEWGYVSRDELESFRGPFRLGIERDLYWTPGPVSQVLPQAVI